MPYSSGPHSHPTSLPAPERSALSSSRRIDFVTGDYVVNAVGGFEPMRGVAQRVLLLVAFSINQHQRFITPADLLAAKDRIRKALRALTDGPEPVAEIKSIEVTNPAHGKALYRVAFRDLTTGQDQTIEA